jgi:hypothetical protein
VEAIDSLVVVSDLHCGCKLGLHPPSPSKLFDGGTYTPSPIQNTVWKWWLEFWTEFVPRVTRGRRWGVVVNGDALDGVHHRSTHQVSQNHADQQEIAYRALAPIVDKAEGRVWMVGGTEAHVGPSSEAEEMLARRLGTVASKTGQCVRYELWKQVGDSLVHLAHHIGTAGSNAYESSAVMRELSEAYVEAGRWQDRAPDALVRSHRHRDIEIKIPAANGYALGVVTPSFQAKTPFSFKIAGGRQAQPQFGGVVLNHGDEDNIYCRHFVKHLDRPEVE